MKYFSRFKQIAAGAFVLASIAATASAAEIRTYLLLGQSHINGHGISAELATLAPELQSPQSDVLFWATGENSWTQLQPGYAYDETRFGPEVSFGRAMADFHGEPIAIIKHAVGGTSLGDDWEPHNGPIWQDMVTDINNAVAGLAPGETLKYEGILWIQGGSDTWRRKNAIAYETNLRNFIQEMRILTNEPDLPFLVFEHLNSGGLHDDILAAQYAVTGTAGSYPVAFDGSNPVPFTALPLNPPGYYPINTVSPGHWNADSCLRVGYDSAAVMQTFFGPPVPVPSIAITSPGEGSQHASGSSVTFSGVASDDIDGDLSGSIFWYIDQDTTPFYIGATTPPQPFADGSYLITATVENSSAQQSSDAITITVGTPPVDYVYTDGPVEYATSPTGGKQSNRHKHLDVTLQVTDDSGSGVGGAAVNIDLNRNGGYQISLSGTTDGSGNVTITYSNAPSGDYLTTVTSVTVNGYTWDGEQPSDPGFTK